MKAVPQHTGLGVFQRQGIEPGDPRVGAVKRGVEAGDLGQVRQVLQQPPHRGQVVRLVEGEQGDEAFEKGQHPRRHPHRSGVVPPPMHHPVTDA
jgi:hypothetical protein